MRIQLLREERFFVTLDGAVWSCWGSGPETWAPYLRVFESVAVIARCTAVRRREHGWTRSDCPGVTFQPLPYFHGPLEYAAKRWSLVRALKHLPASRAATIIRVPSPVANAAVPLFIKQHRPFALEVAGDPYDMYSPGATCHPLRRLFRWHFSRQMRTQCRAATLAKYVTKRALQARYPTAAPSSAFGISDVVLPPGSFTSAPRPRPLATLEYTTVTVGMFEMLYKGHDVLLHAIRHCRKELGLRVKSVLVGGGRYRSYLADLAAQLDIADSVEFKGVLTREQITGQLDQADVFVLPSRQEGTPRALLEAMARGLPAIATSVGGIPEILQDDVLVPPGDPVALAHAIKRVLESSGTYHQASIHNLGVARTYRDEARFQQHDAFLRAVATTCTAAVH